MRGGGAKDASAEESNSKVKVNMLGEIYTKKVLYTMKRLYITNIKILYT